MSMANITPRQKRWMVVGGVSAATIVGVFLMLPDDGGLEVIERRQIDAVLLTGDVRDKSLEHVAARLDEVMGRLSEVEAQIRTTDEARAAELLNTEQRLREEIEARGSAASAASRAELEAVRGRIAALSQDGAPISLEETQETNAVVDELFQPGSVEPTTVEDATIDLPASRQTVSGAGDQGAEAPTPSPITDDPAAQIEAETAASETAADHSGPIQMGEREAAALFDIPQPSFAPSLQPAIASVPDSAGAGGRGPLAIRVISSTPNDVTRELRPGGDEVFLPIGSILTGTLLTGLDAPTGTTASSAPRPVLVRLKHEAILPNKFSAGIEECFVLLSSFGELSSERAMMRGVAISCILRDGTVIQRDIQAYTAGEDGKVGVRGRRVDKRGAVVGRAIALGVLEGVADAFDTSLEIAITQGNVSPQLGAFGGGVGGAFDRVADWYLEQADALFPVIEVDNGREVDIVLTEGLALRLDL